LNERPHSALSPIPFEKTGGPAAAASGSETDERQRSHSSAKKLIQEVEMRFAPSLLPTVLLVGMIACPTGSAFGGTGYKIEGQWELVSSQDLPAGWKEIKLISGGHFIWVIYDAQKKRTAYTGGGTYKIDGDQCTEHVEFMTVLGAEGLIGNDQLVTLEWERERLVITGTLSNGRKLNETWKHAE
jgi:hypothetical protein